MPNATTAILFSWRRFTDYAAEQGFHIPDYGAQANESISQNELDVVAELVDRLADDARKLGEGTVNAAPYWWGSLSGGIRFKFSDPKQALRFKLTWN
jgi:hypothetical protein